MTGDAASEIAPILSVLDVLCPLHIVLAADGRILHTGAALEKLAPGGAVFTGQLVFDVLNIRRPRAEKTVEGLRGLAGRKLHLSLRCYPKGELKGVLVPLGVSGNPLAPYMVLNLSFGISIVDAVGEFNLTAGDFAVTDLAVEMLYLVEAQSAVMQELRRLNTKLDGARQTALAQASTDQLTGLANRRAMDPALVKLQGAATGFALLHLDLDYFKEVNDRFGHAAGDHVLKVAAERLIRCTRADDLVLRLGGDEFMLLLSNVTTTRRVRRVAERIIDALEEPIRFGAQALEISASIGASLAAPGVAVEADTLMRDADTALYAAKDAGRGRFCMFTPSLRQSGILDVIPPDG